MSNVVAITSDNANQTELSELLQAFWAGTDLAASTQTVYGATFEALLDDVGADAKVAKLTRTRLKRHLDGRYGDRSPATYNRNLAAVASLMTFAVDTELLATSPAAGIRRRKPKVTVQAEAQQRPLPYPDLEQLWTDHRNHSLRDRTFWAMAYDTAARADELLNLNIDHLDIANREAVIIGKGGNAERIYWSSTTARLLPRLIAGRTTGPLFIGDRRPRSHLAPAASDLCPTTGRARLSYRRAEEIFKAASAGATLHQLRHSRLTHLAENGEDTTMLKAKSRHRSLRSLERYLNPSPEAIRELTNRHDPNRRGF